LNAWMVTTSIWAQTGLPPGAPGVAGAGTGGGSTLMLALRRWYASLTLSTPDSVSGLAWLWPVVLGLAGVLVLAIVRQGPGRAIGQVLDIPGHLRLYSAAMARLRRSGRLIAVMVGATVVGWTVSQTLTYNNPQGKDDLLLLLKGRQIVPLALEHGVLAGATPLRDVIGLGNLIPLLIASAVLVFQFSTDRWGSVARVISPRASRDAAWGTVCWGATALYAVYRTVGLLYGSFDLPLGNCLGAEIAVPWLMLIADGTLVAWVAVELRGSTMGETSENDSLDLAGVVGLMPAAALVCFLVMPGRYLATALALALPYLPPLSTGQWLNSYVRWQLGWGTVDLQGAGIVAIGLAGVLGWSRGTLGSILQGYWRLLRAEGGHLVGLLIGGGILAGGLTTLAYLLVLSMPTQSWVLASADAYAHYATLPVGLLMFAALVELGERTLPQASLASLKVEEFAGAVE